MKNTKKQIEEQKRIDYFAGLAMQSLILINKKELIKRDYKVVSERITFTSIEIANLIVEQLDILNNEQI
jgi:hypothetical protein